MALIKSTLVKDINRALKASSKGNSQAESEAILARRLASAIDKYIKSGIVNTLVITAGSPTAQTGTGIGAIS